MYGKKFLYTFFLSYNYSTFLLQKDVGGDSLLRKKWTTYQKARLNCSIPGAFPTYFDAIRKFLSELHFNSD